MLLEHRPAQLTRPRYASAHLVNLFLRAASMSLLQSAGVVLLAKHSPWALATAFAISYLWAGNSRAVVVGRSRIEQVAYGLGGLAGASITLWAATR